MGTLCTACVLVEMCEWLVVVVFIDVFQGLLMGLNVYGRSTVVLRVCGTFVVVLGDCGEWVVVQGGCEARMGVLGAWGCSANSLWRRVVVRPVLWCDMGRLRLRGTM